MKLSISNIAWEPQEDEAVYSRLAQLGFAAIEIAPTRWFPQEPYAKAEEAGALAQALRERWGLAVSSIQSIWYQRQERLFGGEEERQRLLDYTRRAMDFAQAIGCGNLVFGCPKNRSIPEGASEETALHFFRACGRYAAAHRTCLALEANPPIYQTNFINTTGQAFDLVKRAACPGFRVNVDLGTMIYYQEPLSLLRDNLPLVNHVHISEPGLAAPAHDQLHRELLELLSSRGYEGYVSIEMGKACGLDAVLATAERIAGLAARAG